MSEVKPLGGENLVCELAVSGALLDISRGRIQQQAQLDTTGILAQTGGDYRAKKSAPAFFEALSHGIRFVRFGENIFPFF